MLFLAPPNAKMRLHWWNYNQNFWLLCYDAQLKMDMHYSSKAKQKNFFFIMHTHYFNYFIDFFSLFFLFLFFHLCSSISLIFSTLSFSFSFLFSKLSLFLLKFFTQILFSFFSNFLSLYSQFFLCCVRVYSFAVWVWVWWAIGIVAMLWIWLVIGFKSCHGCGFMPWCSWVLSWGLCGGSLASWSCCGCGLPWVLFFVVVG